MRTLFFLSVALTAVVLVGCKGNCRRLSEKLCDCSTNTNDNTICLQAAALKESSANISSADDERCRVLFDNCDCHLISTPEGKVRCGLARPFPPEDAGN